MRIARTVVLLSAVVATSACYRWIPADETVVPTGTKVRAVLTDSGREEATRFYGPGQEAVEGPVVRLDDSGLALLVTTRLQREGFPSTTIADTVRFERRHLADLFVQELDRSRTAWFAAGVVGMAASAVIAARTFGGSSEEGGEGGGPPIDNAVIFRIPLGFGFR